MKQIRLRGESIEDSWAAFLSFREVLVGPQVETLVWTALGVDPEKSSKAVKDGIARARAELDAKSNTASQSKAAAHTEGDDFAAALLQNDILAAIRLRSALAEGIKMGNETALAALLVSSIFDVLNLYRLAATGSPIAAKWARLFAVWPWVYSPNRGYQKKLSAKLKKMVGQDLMLGIGFAKSAEGSLGVEAFIGLLWILLVAGYFEPDKVKAQPFASFANCLKSLPPQGQKLLTATLINFLEAMNDKVTIQDKKMAKASPSERRRPIERAAKWAAQLVSSKSKPFS